VVVVVVVAATWLELVTIFSSYFFLASCQYFSDDVRGESCEELQVLLVSGTQSPCVLGGGWWYGVLRIWTYQRMGHSGSIGALTEVDGAI